MLSLDDPRWKGLLGGYKVPYDASHALARLERGENVWKELWQEIHHQGDLGEASYAAVPHLVRIAAASRFRDWNFYGLLSTIEVERHRKSNPPVPAWLEDDYRTAWHRLLDLALADLRDESDAWTARSALGAVALAKGHLKLGAWIALTDDSEVDDDLEEKAAWSDLYSLGSNIALP